MELQECSPGVYWKSRERNRQHLEGLWWAASVSTMANCPNPPQKLPSVPLQIWDARLSTFPFVDTHFHVENSLSPECPTTRNLKTSSPFRSRMLRALEIVPVSPLALEVATEKNLTFQMVRGCSFSFWVTQVFKARVTFKHDFQENVHYHSEFSEIHMWM